MNAVAIFERLTSHGVVIYALRAATVKQMHVADIKCVNLNY